MRINYALGAIVFIVSSLYGFDDNKEGFLLNIGIGTGFIKSKNIQKDKEDKKTNLGVKTSLKLGYGINKSLLLYYINDTNWYSFKDSKDTYASSLNGIGASYFPNEHEKYFISGAVGLSSIINVSKKKSVNKLGYGVKVGAGYEFKPHVNIESDYTYININKSSLNSKKHSFNISVHYMWY
jgi:opacity protein-like surface antigen